MSLFKKKTPEKKENEINAANVDLRNYTPNALKEIERINAAVVILPKNPDNELIEAYAAIKEKNFAVELVLDEDEYLIEMSGIKTISNNLEDENGIYDVSGITVIKGLTKPIRMIASGITVIDKDSRVNFISKSGITAEVNFTISEAKIFSKDIELDNRFIELLPDCSVVVGSGDIIFNKDVVEESIIGKSIYFIACKNIECSKKIRSAVMAKSLVANKIISNG
ncbi:MAG: hypothetical protein K2G73_04375 [Eubacterium sp.]|nr:hypothetical protein [Eubacterium sp.]